MKNYYYYYYHATTTTTTTTTTRDKRPTTTTTTTTTTTAATTTTPRLMMMMMMVVMVVVVLMVKTVSAGHNAELCVVETPLVTPYVRSHRSTPTECLGCLFIHHNTKYTALNTRIYKEVHVLDFESVEGEVVVVVDGGGVGGGGGGVVVLSSPPTSLPVFKIRPPFSFSGGNQSEYLFVVNPGVKVEVTGLPYTTTTTTATTTDLLNTTREKFGVVSSYTRVFSAGEVTLRLGGGDGGGAECGDDGDVVSASPVVQCAKVEPLSVDGCFHRDMLGRGDRDIHIIEVSNSNSSVVVELVGGSGGDSDGVLRNITLVLRAAHSTTWQLVTTHLHGSVTLLVGGEDQVENTSVPGAGVGSGVEVTVRRVDLPATFDQLLLRVLTSIGPPTSYTRANATSHVSLSVGVTDNHINFPSHLRNYDIPTVYRDDPATVIRGGLIVSCSPSAMTLSLPYATAEAVGGVAMALLDRACVGSRNGTHIVLRAEFGRCKFEKREGSQGNFIYANLLSIELGPPLSDDEDLVGSGYGSEDEYYPSALPSLPVTCQGDALPSPSLPPLPPLPPRPPSRLPAVVPPPQTSHRGYSKVPPGVRGASYTLTLYTDASLTHPIAAAAAAAAATPTPVAPHSRLYAQAALASVLPWTTTTTTSTTTTNLRVMLEECWISNTTASTPPHTTTTATTTHLLLRKSCRVHPSVSVEAPFTHTRAPTFSFQVLAEYAAMDVFYLHCQLGVCSPDTLPRPTIIKCIEPSLYCSKPALLKAFERQPASSSLQTLTLGPLTSASTTKLALFGTTHTTSSSQGLHHSDTTKAAATAEVTEGKTQIVVLKGLSTEVVVGIALASFVIGVCLTATLWVIHMKTDPKRQKRSDNSNAPRNSGYDLSAHSGSSTPSSQAPMTA